MIYINTTVFAYLGSHHRFHSLFKFTLQLILAIVFVSSVPLRLPITLRLPARESRLSLDNLEGRKMNTRSKTCRMIFIFGRSNNNRNLKYF